MVGAAGISTRTPLVVARRERFVEGAAAVDGLGQVGEARCCRRTVAAEILVPQNRSDVVRRFADKDGVAKAGDALAAVEHDRRRTILRAHPRSMCRANGDDVRNLPEAPDAQCEQRDGGGTQDPWNHAAAFVLARTIAARIKSAPMK